MDNSTIVFIAVLGIAFIFLRWLIAPIPPQLPNELNEALANNSANNPNRSANNYNSTNNSNRRSRREVSDDMIEVVQTIAPQLTRGQIRMDLERTGSVELTMERYMETGSLPFPPGESAATQNLQPDISEHSQVKKKEPENLIDKYGLKSKIRDDGEDIENIDENKWGSSKEERTSLLNRKREEMILQARRRLASQLQNEVAL